MTNKPNLVAVYGSLLSGLGNHGVLHRLGPDHFELLGETKTEPKFTLFSLGGFPGVHENGSDSIKVEVYRVSDELLEGPLDRLEGYHKENPKSGLYDRVKINTEFGEAYIYTYNGNQRSESIKDGDWRKFRSQN